MNSDVFRRTVAAAHQAHMERKQSFIDNRNARTITQVNTIFDKLADTFVPTLLRYILIAIDHGVVNAEVFRIETTGRIVFEEDNRRLTHLIDTYELQLAALLFLDEEFNRTSICDWLERATGLGWRWTTEFGRNDIIFVCELNTAIYTGENSARRALEERHGRGERAMMNSFDKYRKFIIATLMHALHETADIALETAMDVLRVQATGNVINMMIGTPWRCHRVFTYDSKVDDPDDAPSFLVGFYFNPAMRNEMMAQLLAAFPGVTMIQADYAFSYDFTWSSD